jgi:integrase
MRKIKLTEANVRSLPPAANETDIFIGDTEVPGLKLRLRRGKNGEALRSYWHQFSRSGHKNKSPKFKLGDVGGITLADARQHTRERNGQLSRGQDPVVEKAAAKIKQAQTVESLLPRYLKFKQSHVGTRSFVEVKRHLTRDAQPLHAMPVQSLTLRDIAVLKATIAEDCGGPSSNRWKSSVSGFLGWCLQEGLVQQNVAIHATVEKETPRSRVLSPHELALIWNHLEEGTDFCAIIRLLMLLGSRASEIGQLRWDEVHGDAIQLAAERVKNRKPHWIPLPPLACDILEKLPRRMDWDGSPRAHVFGTRSASAGFNGWHQGKRQLVKRIAKATGRVLPHFTPHDIRRSFSTYLNEFNLAAPHVVEALLGHTGYQSAVAATYNRASYQSERRRAVTLWSELLASWVEGKTSNVVTMQRSA